MLWIIVPNCSKLIWTNYDYIKENDGDMEMEDIYLHEEVKSSGVYILTFWSDYWTTPEWKYCQQQSDGSLRRKIKQRRSESKLHRSLKKIDSADEISDIWSLVNLNVNYIIEIMILYSR